MTGAVKQVWQVIQEDNAHLPPGRNLNTTQCLQLSVLIKRCAALTGLPLGFALATLDQESQFWPQALNDNGQPGNVLAQDVGIAQLHIESILNPKVEALATPEAAVRFALDPAKAVQYAFRLLAQHVNAAKTHRWSATADPRSRNPFWTACVFYNSGATGGARVIEAHKVPEHAHNVATKEVRIARALNLPSVMQDVA